MRISTVVMVAFAVVFGLLAVFVAQTWLTNQDEMRKREMEASKKPLTIRTMVIAAKPIRFGTEITPQHLREVRWPDDALPTGAFATIADLLNGVRRVALGAMEANEPVLSHKITGTGQRATLSSLLREGLKAVTVRVNDVDGVAGFVLPGDRVDVQLTRQMEKNVGTTDVVLQNARVLAIDQVADERSDKPTVVKAVTLEVDTPAAQKIALAASIGTLSLVLRKAGDVAAEYTRRVSISDLDNASTPVAQEPKGASDLTIVSVTRASVRQEYNVPIESKTRHLANATSR